MAIKATYCEVVERFLDSSYCPHTECRNIFKDPITDDGTKKSAKGLLCVLPTTVANPDGTFSKTLTLVDQCTKEMEGKGLLKTVFKDGMLTKFTSFAEVKETLSKQ